MPNSNLLPLAFVLVLASACAGRQIGAPGIERASLHEQHAMFFAALADQDVERVAGLFADEAVLHVVTDR